MVCVTGIRRYTSEIGRLWCSLADYYIRLAVFEKARDIFEEAIESVCFEDFCVVRMLYQLFQRLFM